MNIQFYVISKMRKMNYMECQKYNFEFTENTQLDNAYFTKRSNILTF